jgi:hypothetical protein
MQYCRSLSFTADPEYRYILGLFYGCMERNAFDTKTPYFIGKKNRLFLEKEALKQNMMKVLNKPSGAAATKTGAKDEEQDQGKMQF